MFYFTYLAEGNYQREIWSEFSFAGKLRGTTHRKPNDHIDITAQVSFIDANEGTMTMKSAGSEEWRSSDYDVPGFDRDGNSGIKTRNNSKYKYKQQYYSIWMDLIILRRNQAHQSAIPNGFYDTNFTISTGSNAGGLALPMTLYGQKTSGTVQDFLFRVDRVAPSPFPYQDLINKNSVNNTLRVGEVSFLYDTLSSLPSPPNLKIASNNAGTAANFKLTSAGVPSIPFEVVFDCKIPETGRTHITSPTITFNSVRTSHLSPIDNRTTYKYVGEGDVLIFVPTNIMPLSGTYSSTIYCILSAF